LGVRQANRINNVRRNHDFVSGAKYIQEKQGSYEGHGKTSVAILNEENLGINMIDSYSQDGFRLNDDTKILGPCVIFPTAVLGWRIRDAEDVTEDSLALFTLLDPKLDILVIGHGKKAGTRDPVNPKTILKMRAKGVSVEVLTTEQAIATYNFLIEEGRVVAAALIPPDDLGDIKDDDIIHTKERYKKLLSTPDHNMLGGTREDYDKFYKREK